MRKSVCIIRFFSYPQESHVRRDAECLQKAGYEVDIIASHAKGQKFKETMDGVHVYRLPIAPRRGSALEYLFRYLTFFFLCFITVSWLQLRKGYKAIEVDTMPDFLIFSTVVPKLLGARIILYLFEAMPEFFSAKYNLSQENFIVRTLRAIERLAVKYANHVITVNTSLRALICQRCSLNKNFSVVLNVPNEELWSSSRISPCDSGRFLLVYHGTISRGYGVQTAIKALAHLQKEIEDIHLLIVGEGDYLEKLSYLANELDLEHRIEFISWVPFEKLSEILSRAHIGLVPFIRDGYTDLMLPNKLFEYIALGIPVVVARTKAIQDYFDFDDTCLAFFNPGDEENLSRVLLDLYKNPSKRKELAKNAMKAYQTRYRWEIMRKKYLGIYDTLLGQDG